MLSLDETTFLKQIDSPAALRALSMRDLEVLATEIRGFLLHSLNQSGGHLGSNLGTVELTLALHYVYNTPSDTLVWDVGHQAYVHKMLTGRLAALPTIRQTDGLSPFPKRDESPHDSFGVGHSSTSISAALGFALGNQLAGKTDRSIAIIGDGAMTAGMAFEALNHAGDLHADLLVILNDNDMSISENVGALSNYLAKILAGKIYSHMREGSKKVLEKVPPMWELAKRTEKHVKSMVVPGTLFEELGFCYIGPTDGHDIKGLIKLFSHLRTQHGPKLLHVVTRKGKGYLPAEQDPIKYHGVSAGFYAPPSAPINKPAVPPLTYSHVFGQWICDMAERCPDLVAITPAMREGSDLIAFAAKYPQRYFDVGIAEQHSVTLAAGLACAGKKPVVAIYSTFLQRAYDQLIHDVCIQNLPVLFAIDRAGLVGGDGTTHNGNFDLSFLRCIPNLIVMAPSDENECYQMLYTGFLADSPACVRYPRGYGPGVPIDDNSMTTIALGKAHVRRQGRSIAILAFGTMLHTALEVGEVLNATVVNMRFIKPLDETLLSALSQEYELLVTLEENVVAGGAGSAVNEYLTKMGIYCACLNLGLPDNFLHHGDPKQLLQRVGLDKTSILNAIKLHLGKIATTTPSLNTL